MDGTICFPHTQTSDDMAYLSLPSGPTQTPMFRTWRRLLTSMPRSLGFSLSPDSIPSRDVSSWRSGTPRTTHRQWSTSSREWASYESRCSQLRSWSSGSSFCRYVVQNVWSYYRGSQSLQNLIAISQRSSWLVLTLKAGCIGNDGKNWLVNLGTSSQSEGHSSKWLIWLVCREPLHSTAVLSQK